MKLNELQLSDVKQFLRVDYDEDEEFSSVALMIISDLYENRKAVENTATSTSINKIYDSMLNLYCVNLL